MIDTEDIMDIIDVKDIEEGRHTDCGEARSAASRKQSDRVGRS